MAFNLGINVLEVDGRAAPSIQPAPTSVAAFVIRARRGAPGVVYRISNWTQFLQTFDGYMPRAYGAYALRGFFDNGGSLAYVTRIVGEGALPATRTLKQDDKDALVVRAGSRGRSEPGGWGKSVGVQVTENDDGTYNLLVSYNKAVVETWGGLNNNPNGPGTLPEILINDEFTGSRFIVVEVPVEGNAKVTRNPAKTIVAAEDEEKEKPNFLDLEANELDDAFDQPVIRPATPPVRSGRGGRTGRTPGRTEEPVGGTEEPIAGPEEPAAAAAASEPQAILAAAAAEALPLFDIHEIQLVCCPETTHNNWTSEVKTYCADRGDCMFIGHLPETSDAAAAQAYAAGQNLRGDKVFGALYFPWILVRDPIGTQKWIPPVGHVIGVYARTERERGIWKAPAGNAAAVNGALDVRFHITDLEHTSLVKDGGVNAIRYLPGQGIVLDSSRTLSTNPMWLYVNVRLLFNFVKSSLKSGLRWVVQEPNDQTLWNKVRYNAVTPFLMGLWRRGAFGPGAPEDVFEVKINEENNPPASIQQGLLTVEVSFYPSRPAETIIIIVGQQEGAATTGEA